MADFRPEVSCICSFPSPSVGGRQLPALTCSLSYTLGHQSDYLTAVASPRIISSLLACSFSSALPPKLQSLLYGLGEAHSRQQVGQESENLSRQERSQGVRQQMGLVGLVPSAADGGVELDIRPQNANNRLPVSWPSMSEGVNAPCHDHPVLIFQGEDKMGA